MTKTDERRLAHGYRLVKSYGNYTVADKQGNPVDHISPGYSHRLSDVMREARRIANAHYAARGRAK